MTIHRGETDDICRRFTEQANISFPVLRNTTNAVYKQYRGGIAPQFAPFPRDIIIDQKGDVLYYAKEYYPDKIDRILQQQVQTSVLKETPKQIASDMELYPNYPNPFNSSTLVSFQVNTGPVSLTVFNLQGQLIKILTNEFKKEGHYTVYWDGTDINNSHQPSGV